jgi:uncharacterized protein YodC (DUF2158 family)
MVDFPVEQIARLNSGGPMMTIGSVDGDDALCVWFVDDKLREHRFPMQSLIPVDLRTLSDELLQDFIQGPTPFRIGEIVKLKSGGPNLTVRSIHGPQVDCLWFCEGKLNQATLPSATLISTELEPLSEAQLQELIDGEGRALVAIIHRS